HGGVEHYAPLRDTLAGRSCPPCRLRVGASACDATQRLRPPRDSTFGCPSRPPLDVLRVQRDQAGPFVIRFRHPPPTWPGRIGRARLAIRPPNFPQFSALITIRSLLGPGGPSPVAALTCE